MSATFLPSVAIEQGWDKRTTLINLIKKAGYGGEINDDFINNVNVLKYKTICVKMDWKEYERKKRDIFGFKKNTKHVELTDLIQSD